MQRCQRYVGCYQAENILAEHAEQRALARLSQPQRFNVQPTIGQLALRQQQQQQQP